MTKQRTTHPKRELKKIDLDILKRIMIVIYEAGRSNKTTISRNSNMSYDKCIKYLNCLEMLEFIKRQKGRSENKKQIYVYDLTVHGIHFVRENLILTR